jgi:hypothetical protein
MPKNIDVLGNTPKKRVENFHQKVFSSTFIVDLLHILPKPNCMMQKEFRITAVMKFLGSAA